HFLHLLHHISHITFHGKRVLSIFFMIVLNMSLLKSDFLFSVITHHYQLNTIFASIASVTCMVNHEYATDHHLHAFALLPLIDFLLQVRRRSLQRIVPVPECILHAILANYVAESE